MNHPYRCSATLALVASLLATGFTAQRSFADSPAADTSAITHTASASSANYVLHTTDLVSIKVTQDANIAIQARIDSDGTVSFTYLDDPVKLSGLTVNQAIKAIAKLYTDHQIFIKPQVSLVVLEYAEQHINVVGQINHPGPVIIPPGETMTLVSAVTAAGGHTRIASPDVTITRMLPDGKSQTIHADLKSAMVDASKDIPLQDGDTVYVDEALIGW
jgi:polysaccharide export outer membrane protein